MALVAALFMGLTSTPSKALDFGGFFKGVGQVFTDPGGAINTLAGGPNPAAPWDYNYSTPDVAIPRVGKFAEKVETPTCSNLWDGVKKYSGRSLNAAVKLNPMSNLVRSALTGENVIDNFKDGISSANNIIQNSSTVVGDVAGQVIKHNPYWLMNDVLPEGGFKDFMESVRAKTSELGSDIARDTVSKVGDDFSEVAGDAVGALAKIDDPEAFFEEFARLQEKWNPSVTLRAAALKIAKGENVSDVLEDATGKLMRQLDIASTYMVAIPGGPGGLVYAHAKQLKKMHAAGTLTKKGAISSVRNLPKILAAEAASGQTAKKIAKGLVVDAAVESLLSYGEELASKMGSDGEKQAAKIFVGSLAARVADGGEEKLAMCHPFHSDAYAKVVPAQPMGSDAGSGGYKNMHHWHPDTQGDQHCISLGDVITETPEPPTLFAMCSRPGGNGVFFGKNDWWAYPVDYAPLWNSSCAGDTFKRGRSIWVPICPEGFATPGMVVGYEGSTKPTQDRIACLRRDPRIMDMVDGVRAGLKKETDDEGSGAKMDVSIFNRTTRGIPMSWAVPGYIGDSNAEKRAFQVPIVKDEPARCLSPKCGPDQEMVFGECRPSKPYLTANGDICGRELWYAISGTAATKRRADRRKFELTEAGFGKNLVSTAENACGNMNDSRWLVASVYASKIEAETYAHIVKRLNPTKAKPIVRKCESLALLSCHPAGQLPPHCPIGQTLVDLWTTQACWPDNLKEMMDNYVPPAKPVKAAPKLTLASVSAETTIAFEKPVTLPTYVAPPEPVAAPPTINPPVTVVAPPEPVVNSPQPLCPEGTELVGDLCQYVQPTELPAPSCPEGTELIGEQCMVSQTTELPAPSCPEGTVFNDVECVYVAAAVDPAPTCPQGTYFNDVECVYEEVYQNPAPSCPEGTIFNDVECVYPGAVADPAPSCPEGTYFDGSTCVYQQTAANTADCPSGTSLVNGQCEYGESGNVGTPGGTSGGFTPATETLYPREVQSALKRAGCLPGRVDGIWGKGSRAALANFYRHSGARNQGSRPTGPVLDAVQGQPGRICPVIRRVIRTAPTAPIQNPQGDVAPPDNYPHENTFSQDQQPSGPKADDIINFGIDIFNAFQGGNNNDGHEGDGGGEGNYEGEEGGGYEGECGDC